MTFKVQPEVVRLRNVGASGEEHRYGGGTGLWVLQVFFGFFSSFVRLYSDFMEVLSRFCGGFLEAFRILWGVFLVQGLGLRSSVSTRVCGVWCSWVFRAHDDLI